MKYIPFSMGEKSSYRIVVLDKYLRANEIRQTFLVPLKAAGVMQDHVLAIQNTQSKKVGEIKEFLSELLPQLLTLKTDYILVTDAATFKVLTKSKRADNAYGYAIPCVVPGFEHISVMFSPSPVQVKFAPELQERVNFVCTQLGDHWKGQYVEPGQGTKKTIHCPKTVEEIRGWMDKLAGMPLGADTENFSLKHYDAGIGTIAFAWSETEAVAFAVDYTRSPEEAQEIRALLREFFVNYSHNIKWHQVNYDVYVLIYQLFMKGLLDTEGLLYGLDVMLRNWDCTKLISYLATNSAGGNSLSMKDQAQEFLGNYAVDDIKDITKIPLPELLEYNAKDAMGVLYVYNKHWPTLVNDQQSGIYCLFKDWMVDIIQMQLTGMPLDMEKVQEGKAKMQEDYDKAVGLMMSSPYVSRLTTMLNLSWVEWKNTQLKKKRVTIDDANITFNPNSGPQTQRLLYEVMQLPQINFTDSGQPSVDKETLEALKNHTTEPDKIQFLDAFIAYRNVEKILTAFIPAFEAAPQAEDGWHYLFGSYNLGGTLSGRLSSSDPNMQNLPSTGSKYAKLVKEMFSAPPGWLFVGLDFNSLEDRISALTTKDPNKLAVYQGHLVYEVDIDGVTHHIRDDSTVVYEGKTYRVQEFYERWCADSSFRA